MRETSRQFLDLLHDETFKELYRHTNKELLGWAQFKSLPMPQGFTAEEVWHILTAVRRIEAHTLPYKPYTHRELPTETWCSTDNAIGTMLRELVVMASDEAALAQAPGQHRHFRSLAQDLAAALHRDGFEADPTRIYQILTHRAEPQPGKETVVANAAAVVADIERYARYPFTPWMLEELVTRLDADGLRPEHAEWVCPAFPYGTQTTEQLLDSVFATVNRRDTDPEIYLLDLVATFVAFWDLVPLPAWNGLVEIFVRHWAFERMGLGALRSVPFSHLCLLAWGGNEDFESSAAIDGPFGVNPDIGEAHDATSFFGNVLSLLIKGLHDEQTAASQEQASLTLRLDEANRRLNPRQRDALQSMLADPADSMTLAAYMRLYRVSYGTARNDLLALADQGLAEQAYEGRALVFKASAQARQQAEE